MQTKQTILQLAAQYMHNFKSEHKTLQPFIQFFDNTNTDHDLYDRNNFDGHITASAFILNNTLDSVLLLNHKKLNRWLQPGGHVDESDASLPEAALREAVEETGIKSEQLELLQHPGYFGIFDIDSHLIPANINKNEPAHLHHDIRYVFKCQQNIVIDMNAAEATGFKWVPISEFKADPTFSQVSKKVIDIIAAIKQLE